MGSKQKKKTSTKAKMSSEQRLERKRILAKERQKRWRARLLGKNVDEKKTEKKKGSSLRSQKNLDGTPEEISVQVDIKEECNSDEENTQKEEPESELLPGPKGQKLYYDGTGYYYTQLYEDVTYRWLQCSHGECRVMAQMKQYDKAPIHPVDQASQHCHPANPARRDRILFLHTVKTRHANESTPFNVIFQQEAYKNPVGASFFSFDKIQAHLQKKISLGGSDTLSQESVLSAASKLSMIPRPPSIGVEPVAKKRKLNKDQPLTENRFKKLDILKSLKDVSVTECESSESTDMTISQSTNLSLSQSTNLSLSQSTNLSLSQSTDLSLSQSTDLSLSQPSERIPGPYPHFYLYHDGQGNFYKPLYTSGSTRHLVCNTTGCQAKAVMAVDDNSPITLETDSPAHDHQLMLGPSRKEAHSPPSIRPVDISTMQCQEKENRLETMGTPMVVLNKYPVVDQRKRFDKLEGPEYFYDFRGHYYFSTRTEKGKRLLRCLYPTCLAQAMMSVEGATEIQPMSGTPPHNHKPDLTRKYHSKIREWEDQWSESLPSERLPSLRVQYCCYHDGRGYFYHQTTQNDNIRYLACTEPRCPVKAYMSTLKDAPITISGLRMGHAHGPDHTLRDALLFIDAVRVRVRSDTPPATAIALETARNPVGAERVDFVSLKRCLEQAVKLAKDKFKEGMTEDEVDFSTCLKCRKSVTSKPSTDYQVPMPNHFTSPRPTIDDEDYDKSKYLIEQQIKSELVPALLSDTWLYHDGCGYYYNTKSIKNGYRYMRCVLPKCGVQGLVAQAGGPVKLQRPHSHGPQPPQHRLELWFFHKIKIRAQRNPDTPTTSIYREVAEKDPEGAALVSQEEVVHLMKKYLFSVIKPGSSENDKNSVMVNVPVDAEIITNASGGCQYYDGQGYYYTIDNTVKRSTTRFLKCSHHATCSARVAFEDGKLKKITGHSGPRHNHPPDFLHREICLFTQSLKKRARDQDTPVPAIYEEEAKRYPKAAAVLKEHQIKEKLISIRKFVKNEVSLQAEEEEDSEDNVNSSDQARPFVASEVLPGKTWVYYDGRGYFYHETFTTNQMRYLMCCEPHCVAQARMGLMVGSPVVGGPRHCHAPDPLRRRLLLLVGRVRQRVTQPRGNQPATVYKEEVARDPIIAAQIPKDYILNLIINNVPNAEKKSTGSSVKDQHISEDDNLWAFSESGERLPSEHGWLYHNNRGYFYYSHDVDKSNSRRILRCCEDGCDATARLEGDLRISRLPGSVLHNHNPDPQRLALLLLLHRVATRAQVEHARVTDIFGKEAQGDPDAAAHIPKNKLNETIENLTVRKYFKELEEEELGLEEETNEEFLKGEGVEVEPCETLPSPVSGEPVYHDSEGHYYTRLRKTNDRLYVKCLMPVCTARGYIQSSEPWRLYVPLLWDRHNHEPDIHYRDKLLFINNVKKRVLSEDTPVDVIYREESEKEPEFFLYGADKVNEIAIKNLMYKLRKSKSVEDDMDTFPFEDFAEDVTRSSAEDIFCGSPQKVSKPAMQTVNTTRQVNENVEHHVDQTPAKSPMVLKMESRLVAINEEMKESAEDGDDEYTEEEYLEEERLEEETTGVFQSSKSSKSSKGPPLKRRSSKSSKNPSCVLKVERGSVLNNITHPGMLTGDVVLPSEKLPSHTSRSIYHNGRGYYFQVDTIRENSMYMSCIEPMCSVRGIKLADQDEAPINPTTHMDHNHKPDFTRRKHLLFIKHCKERAAAELNLTINAIWAEEAARDPESASQFNASKIRTQMNKYRHEQAANPHNQTFDSSIKQSKPLIGPKEYKERSYKKEAIVKTKVPSSPEQPVTPPVAKIEPPVDIHKDTIPEKIPSLVGDTLLYANGYFYSTCSTSESIEKVKCVEKTCVARAQVSLGDRGQPLAIKLCPPLTHCHPPDLNRRDQMLFIERCKRRAATTLQSVEEIYYDEAAKAPEVAAQLSAVRVKRAMGIAKKERMKKGGRLDYDSAGSGDYGMAELGEMAKVQVSTAGEETVPMDQGDYCPEDTDDLWTVDPQTLTPDEKMERRKALARERQRRRRIKLAEDPSMRGQLELEKMRARERASAWQRQKTRQKQIARMMAKEQQGDDSDWEPEPNMKPLLGPKFLKEDYEEEEEVLDQSYSDYVTLEDDLDACETVLEYDEDQDESNIQTENHEEGASHLEEEPKKTQRSHLIHGRRVNSYNYHDGNGFFYETLKISDNRRYVKCVVLGCEVGGSMPLGQDDAPVTPTADSPAHSHPPDPCHEALVRFVQRCETRAHEEETLLQTIYDEEAEADPVSASKLVMENLMKRMIKVRVGSLDPATESELNSSDAEDTSDKEENSVLENYEETIQPVAVEGEIRAEEKKSEVLPGYRFDNSIYHDMNGYYYIFNALRGNKRYLRCIETSCRVRGSMELYDGAPIQLSSHCSQHNHPPDFQRKKFVLFLQVCKHRAVTEDTPIAQIYQEECDKNPVSATMISSQNLLQRMQRARKQNPRYYPTDEDQNKFAEARSSNPITTDIPLHELIEEGGKEEENPQAKPLSEDQLQPSEALPGVRPNSTMYHDGRGYYYVFNNQTENTWYLRCVEPQCRVRAHMRPVEGSPIVQSANTVHNHRPDYMRKRFVLWMEQAKQRAVTEDLPIPTIYAQEAARDPQSASMIPQENMKTRLYRARKSVMNKVSSELDDFDTEDEASNAELLIVKKVDTAGGGENKADEDQDTMVTVANSDQDQDSEAVFTIQTEGSQDSNTVYLYQPSEPSQQSVTYVDESGFCYQQTTVRSSTRYLKCVEAGCKASASMGLDEDSGITLSKQGSHHNHTADQSRLAMLVEPDSAPIQVIYTDDDGGQQVALCHIADGETHTKRPYKQRHKPELTIDPEEPPVDVSTLCEVDYAGGDDMAESDYYHNEDRQKYPLKPSEVIPGMRPDANNYHDGNGFYYELNRLSPNIRYLKCLIKDCKARAYMELGKENAPIIQTNFARHNHAPDPSRKQFTVFLHRVTRRAAEEDTPINVIYQQEAERDPQSARQIRMENVKQRMMRFRKKHRQGKMNQETASSSEVDMDGFIYHFFMKEGKQELVHQDEAENEKDREGVTEEEREGEGEREGEEVLYESYVISEVEVESQK